MFSYKLKTFKANIFLVSSTTHSGKGSASVFGSVIFSFSDYQQELGKTWEDIQNENEEEEEYKTESSAGEEWVDCISLAKISSGT